MQALTLLILWEEYIAAERDGYRYSRFCELYRAWDGCRPRPEQGFRTSLASSGSPVLWARAARRRGAPGPQRRARTYGSVKLILSIGGPLPSRLSRFRSTRSLADCSIAWACRSRGAKVIPLHTSQDVGLVADRNRTIFTDFSALNINECRITAFLSYQTHDVNVSAGLP